MNERLLDYTSCYESVVKTGQHRLPYAVLRSDHDPENGINIQVLCPAETPYTDWFRVNVTGNRLLLVNIVVNINDLPNWVDPRFRSKRDGYYFARRVIKDIGYDIFKSDDHIRSEKGLLILEAVRMIRADLAAQITMGLPKEIAIAMIPHGKRRLPVVIDVTHRQVIDVLEQGGESTALQSWFRSNREMIKSNKMDILTDGDMTVYNAIDANGLRKLEKVLAHSNIVSNATSTILRTFSVDRSRSEMTDDVPIKPKTFAVKRFVRYRELIHFNERFDGLVTDPDLL